ncbi:DNA polymerase IV [Collimonas fungivorans]|uniref:DNA polymerase IV n=1 Tax=Collimonas fungivorans TaxID=158899 RepID=UPI003FA37339
MPSPIRRIAHLDMDAFYASVELLRYPELRGQAVVIGGGSRHKPEPGVDGKLQYHKLRDYVGRGVVTTSTYEARAFGVFSAMGMMKAAKLAPDAILLPTDFESYRHYSRLFKAAVAEIAPLIEDRGIDEIYMDLSQHPDDIRVVAQRIKDAVRAATGLSCSIGIAPNKLLAKISSELEKPNGLTVITEADIPSRIWPLAARKVNGIGPKAAEKLTALGVNTIGELAATDPAVLQENFGRTYSEWLMRASHGLDDRPVVTSSETKSISRETTFERDLHAKLDRDTLTPIFTDLCVRLAGDLQRKGYVARTIGIKLRFADFQIVTRDLTLPDATDEATAIRHAAGECLRRVTLDRRLRLLGVRASALTRKEEAESEPVVMQGELFNDE